MVNSLIAGYPLPETVAFDERECLDRRLFYTLILIDIGKNGKKGVCVSFRPVRGDGYPHTISMKEGHKHALCEKQ